jgi:Bacterial Ig-like domain (group 3)/FG-GAP repeat
MIRSWAIGVLAAIAAALAVAPGAQAAVDSFFQAATLTNANGVAGDYAGGSVAVSADGSTMVVGVPGASSNEGLAYVYTRGANGWQSANQPAVLAASNGAGGDQFGHSVAVSQDGSVVAVGALYATAGGTQRGTVYVFNRPAGGWAAQTTLNQTTSASGSADYDRLGASVAVSPDGTYVAAGASGYSSSGPLTGQGGVYVWNYGAGALTTVGTEPLTAGDAGNEDVLGWSVAMPSDGLIYAGAPYHPGNDGPGAVYGFSSESSIEVGYSPWAHVSKTELSASGSSLFGFSVATGGGVVAAGAPDTGSNQGAVYLFEPAFGCATQLIHGCFKSSSTTTPNATMTYPLGNGQLGYGVALTGDGSALLAGAPGEPVPPNAPPGRAYVFQAPSGGWADATAPNATLGPDDATANDSFGTSVALSSEGGALAVGGPGGAGDDQMTPGEADVFEAETLTAPTCQPTAVGVGQQTTCTATVTDDGIGEAAPTGTVNFSTDSAGSFGSAPSCALSEASAGTSSCQVTYTPSAAGSGRHTLTASYSGDDEHASGIGQTVVSINRVTTSTTVSCRPAPVAVGQSTNCTATVTASDASAGTPVGTVTMSSNGGGTFNPGGCTLSGGSGPTASCAFSYTPSQVGPGTHQLTASYAGDGGHAASQGSDPLGVGEAGTGTSLSCTPLSVGVGHTARCTVTVTDTSSGTLVPTGTVTLTTTGSGAFSDGGNCTLAQATGGAAVCTFTYTPATAATSSPRLSAHYAGDTDHFGSSASALLQVPATGTPAVGLSSATVTRGRIRISLTCPKSEEYCRVTVTVTVGSGTLAAGSARIAGGRRATLALAPKRATLQRLRAGRYPVTVTVAAMDQSRHTKRTRLSGYCVTGAHFKLVALHVR